MRVSTLLVAGLALVAAVGSVGVSAAGDYSRIRSLHRYFTLVLDVDHNGGLSQTEYQQHLEEMDPSATPRLPLSYTNLRHNELDLDGDELITAQEMCVAVQVCDPAEVDTDVYEWILAANATEPVQIHLAAATVPDHITINWSQNCSDSTNPTGEVQWGTVSGTYTESAPATWSNYTVTLMGLSYTSLPLFNATMTGLLPNTKIYYVVGNSIDGFSPEMAFTSLPDPTVPAEKQITTRMVVYGDQGTVIPMGQTVCKWVEAENAINPFGMLLHVGDLAYAGVSHSMGEYEPTWDAWMQQITPIASTMPYMTSVGNHEDFFNFASYDARFNMPGPESRGNASFWWSMDQGPVHITSFSSESDYTPGSVQYQWLEADMAAARANPNVKWLLFSGHRPLYSSDTDEYSAHQPGCPLLVALEGLINKYAVDLVLTGHEHMYERTWPTFNGTVINGTAPGACSGQKDHELGLLNEKSDFWSQVDSSMPLQVFDRDAQEVAPIYIVQATAGVFQFDKLVEPQPNWSNQRLVGTWGYGVLSVSTTSSGCSTLLYQFRTVVNQAVVVIDQVALTRQVSNGAGKEIRRDAAIALE